MKRKGFIYWFKLDVMRVILGLFISILGTIVIIGGLRNLDGNGLSVVILGSVTLVVFILGNYVSYKKWKNISK